jgi:prevent-host-death family protein
MAVKVSVHEAKTHLSLLVRQALAGEEVIITRAGRQLVRLAPVEPTPRRLGTAKGDFVVPDKFGAPFSSEVLDQFEQ